MWESVFRSGVLIQRLTDCDWSIHFWRRAAASMTHLWSMSNAVRYLCFRSAGIRSMSFNSPSKYFKLSIMSRSQRPRALRSLTRNGFRTMNSPDRFDLTKRFLYVGSMQGDVFVMFEIVAVGAIASTLLLRMPWAAIFRRSGAQSIRALRDTLIGRPRSSSSSSTESSGRSPRSHFEPLYDEYVPRSAARSELAS